MTTLEKLFSGELSETQIVKMVATTNDGNTLKGINDIVLSRKLIASAIRYRIWANGELLRSQVVADSLVVSTPFGSTGYFQSITDREDWTFTPEETENLRGYLERGGFIYVDAGITAAFLRDRPELGQHHSYAEWEASPELKEAFKPVFPNHEFQTLRRSDPLVKKRFQNAL